MRPYNERNGPATRAAILACLLANPGLTKTQLCSKVGLSWGTISHHIRILHHAKAVVGRQLSGRIRLYVSTMADADVVQTPMHDPVAPRLIEILAEKPGLNIKQLSIEAGQTRKVIRRCLTMMVAAGAVKRQGTHRPRFCLPKRPMVQVSEPVSNVMEPAESSLLERRS